MGEILGTNLIIGDKISSQFVAIAAPSRVDTVNCLETGDCVQILMNISGITGLSEEIFGSSAIHFCNPGVLPFKLSLYKQDTHIA